MRTLILCTLLLGNTNPLLMAAPVPPDKNKETQAKLVGQWEQTKRSEPPLFPGESFVIEFTAAGKVTMVSKHRGMMDKQRAGSYRIGGNFIHFTVTEGLSFGDDATFRWEITSMADGVLTITARASSCIVSEEFRKKTDK